MIQGTTASPVFVSDVAGAVSSGLVSSLQQGTSNRTSGAWAAYWAGSSDKRNRPFENEAGQSGRDFSL